MDAAARSWWEGELAGSTFADATAWASACASWSSGWTVRSAAAYRSCASYWANTKAAYRFFANDRVSEAQILAGHFQATRDRFVGELSVRAALRRVSFA